MTFHNTGNECERFEKKKLTGEREARLIDTPNGCQDRFQSVSLEGEGLCRNFTEP